MKIGALILATAISGAMCACSKKQPEPPAPQVGGVIPQAQLDALNKAKSVESTVMQDAQRQREQIDATQ